DPAATLEVGEAMVLFAASNGVGEIHASAVTDGIDQRVPVDFSCPVVGGDWPFLRVTLHVREADAELFLDSRKVATLPSGFGDAAAHGEVLSFALMQGRCRFRRYLHWCRKSAFF